MLALSAVCKIYDTTVDMASIRGLANVFVIAGNVWYVYIWAAKIASEKHRLYSQIVVNIRNFPPKPSVLYTSFIMLTFKLLFLCFQTTKKGDGEQMEVL